MRKIISLLLTVAMVLSLLPIGAFATGDPTYRLQGALTRPGNMTTSQAWEVHFQRDDNNNGNFGNDIGTLNWLTTSSSLSFDFQVPVQTNGHRVWVTINQKGDENNQLVQREVWLTTPGALAYGVGDAALLGKTNVDRTGISGEIKPAKALTGAIKLPAGKTATAKNTVLVQAIDKATGKTIAQRIERNHFAVGESAYNYNLDIPLDAAPFYLSYWIPASSATFGGEAYAQAGYYSATVTGGTVAFAEQATVLNVGDASTPKDMTLIKPNDYPVVKGKIKLEGPAQGDKKVRVYTYGEGWAEDYPYVDVTIPSGQTEVPYAIEVLPEKSTYYMAAVLKGDFEYGAAPTFYKDQTTSTVVFHDRKEFLRSSGNQSNIDIQLLPQGLYLNENLTAGLQLGINETERISGTISHSNGSSGGRALIDFITCKSNDESIVKIVKDQTTSYYEMVGLKEGNTTVEVVADRFNPNWKKTIPVKVVNKGPVVEKSKINTLSSIKVNQTVVPNFTSDKFKYQRELAPMTTEADVTVTLTDGKSKAAINGVEGTSRKITGLKLGENLLDVKVTSESGEWKLYVLSLMVPKAYDATDSFTAGLPVEFASKPANPVQIPSGFNQASDTLLMSLKDSVKDVKLVLPPAVNGVVKAPALEVGVKNTNGDPVAAVKIERDTVVTASSGNWDGTLGLPTIKDTPAVTVAGTTHQVVQVGLPDVELTFDKPVRILLPGMAGKSVKWSRGNQSGNIDKILRGDSLSDATADLTGGLREGKINVGSDLVIWTKHFTEFVAYTPAPVNNGGSSGGGGGGSSSSTTPVTPQPVVAVPQPVQPSPVVPVTPAQPATPKKATAAELIVKSGLKDIKNHKAVEAIAALTIKGVFKADASGKFNPYREMNTGEFMGALAKTLNLKPSKATTFKGMNKADPNYAYVAALVEKGILAKTYKVGKTSVLSEKEFNALLAKAYEVQEGKKLPKTIKLTDASSTGKKSVSKGNAAQGLYNLMEAIK